LERIHDRTLRHLAMYSPLIPHALRATLTSSDATPQVIRNSMTISHLSEFPLLLSGQLRLSVPVFTVWGACEDVVVLEKFRLGTYDIENLHIIDEATTRCLDVGGVKLRLLGLGGAFVPHKLFDNGEGNGTIAGGQGTMWTTALQIGELVDTAQRVMDPTETRVLITHASPGREGIMAQLALVLKADLTISAGLHFRYTSSWNEFSVQGDFEGFRHKIVSGKAGFDKIWENVKPQVEAVVDENQRILLGNALSVIERVPTQQQNIGPGANATGEEPAWKNCWNWNLCDAAYGSLVLEVKEGRISAELKSQGFNYAYRRSATPATAVANAGPALQSSNNAGSGTNSPAQAKYHAPLPPKSNGPSVTSTPPPPARQLPQTAPASGRETPKEPTGSGAAPAKVNVNGTPATSPPDAKKPDNKKKKGPKDRQGTEGEDGSTASGKATPAPAEPVEKPAAESESNPISPTAGTDSPGVRTPMSRKPPRNPWTIYMKYSVQASEDEIREFFGEAKSGITRINFPVGHNKMPGPRLTYTAFVEFGDEEAMRAGLAKHEEKLKGVVPMVTQAEDREPREYSNFSGGGFRGRGRGGRGGGGFAARGFAAAGLTRSHSDNKDRKPNGDAGGSGGEGKSG